MIGRVLEGLGSPIRLLLGMNQFEQICQSCWNRSISVCFIQSNRETRKKRNRETIDSSNKNGWSFCCVLSSMQDDVDWEVGKPPPLSRSSSSSGRNWLEKSSNAQETKADNRHSWAAGGVQKNCLDLQCWSWSGWTESQEGPHHASKVGRAFWAMRGYKSPEVHKKVEEGGRGRESVNHSVMFKSLWTIACQAPLSMEFSRQQYWRS